MMHRLTRLAAACGAAALLTGGAVAAPLAASAQIIDQNTLNSLLTQIGTQILYNRVVGQQQPSNTVVGYTANGGTIYGDGRIVMPNGQTYYPNGNGVYPWGQPAYYSPSAAPSNYQYDYQRTGRWDRTHRHGNNGRHNGWNRGRGNPHHGDDDGD